MTPIVLSVNFRLLMKESDHLPAPTRKKLMAEKHIEEALQRLPFYVSEFVRAK